MASEKYSTVRMLAPPPNGDWALFLDIDGTLLDIAPTPDTVIVPKSLLHMLPAVQARLGGALAIVSGRPMSDIDRLLGATGLTAVAEHGAIIRIAGTDTWHADATCAVPQAWQNTIADATRNWPGVMVEFKNYSVAAHYRAAPARQGELKALLDGVVAPHSAAFEVLPAHCGFEIRHRSLHKGAAVRNLMRCAPFAGRLPVFVGDDVTDEDGFRVAAELGGFGLRVGDAFDGQPANVRRWLNGFVSPR